MIPLTPTMSLVTDPKAVANKFNNYFVNDSKNLLKDMGESSNQYQDYLKNPTEHSFFLKEIEPIETLKLLKNLNSKISSDIYGIPSKLIEIAASFLAEELTLIFNAFFQEGNFPNKLKAGTISVRYTKVTQNYLAQITDVYRYYLL